MTNPIEEKLQELSKQIPDEEWEKFERSRKGRPWMTRDMILEWAGKCKECEFCTDEWPCHYHCAELDIILITTYPKGCESCHNERG
uniref:Uncharacterized protein n=1 Tax=viral metagenome TaxID=1070528 RepID=A0A6M3LHE8_9ZZZZ